MIYLAYFTFGFALLRFLVASSNLIFKQNLPASKLPTPELVSILIPARNEEKNIGALLNDLSQLKISNLEIIVFNDQSTDSTSEIVESFCKKDSRIRLIHSDGLPTGWLGKNFACHQLAKAAKGNYFLFLDADVRILGDIVSPAIEYSKRHNLGLLSIFPKQLMQTAGEQITVPNMNFILLSQLPLALVLRSGFASLSAANGQFMFFKADTYKDKQPHLYFKQAKVEDIETARYFKKNKIRIACLTGNDAVACRMYSGYKDAVNGFSKNVVMFFGNSFPLAIAFWLFTTFGLAFIAVCGSIWLVMLYLILVILTRIFISIVSRQSVILNLIYLVPQQFSMGEFIYRAITNSLKKQYQWKGRNI